MEHRLNSEEKIEEIKPGRFTSSQNGKATFFVDNVKDNKLNKIFFNSISVATTTVENSKTATYYTDSELKRYIILKDGVITELLAPYKSNTRITKYSEHGVQLGQDLPIYTNNKYDAMDTIHLLSVDDIEASAELQSRFMLPIATLILEFAAVPLSYSSPRKGRYNKIFFGALVYFSYFIIMSIAEKMFLLNIVPIFLGLWWIHLLVILALYYIYVSDYKRIPSRK